MKTSLPLLALASIAILASSCASDKSTGSTQSPVQVRPTPALDQIQDAKLSVAGGRLFLTDYEREYNRSILDLHAFPTTQSEVQADGSRKVMMQPAILEAHASGGSGGLVRIADSGSLDDFHLEQAKAAIEAKGIVRGLDLVSGQTVDESERKAENAGFTAGSIWTPRNSIKWT